MRYYSRHRYVVRFFFLHTVIVYELSKSIHPLIILATRYNFISDRSLKLSSQHFISKFPKNLPSATLFFSKILPHHRHFLP